MYEELVKRLRHDSESRALMEDAADAIEERDKYALTIQHEMMAEAEYHIALVERLNGEIEELSKQNKKWEEVVKTALDFIPCWVSVEERLPGREWVLCECRANIHEVLSLRDGYWYHDPQHQYMSGFVTHWMPLPESPEEET